MEFPAKTALLLLLCLAPAAQAGIYANQCQKASQAADAECKGAVAAVQAADAARSSATGASAGTNINSNSGALQRDIASQRSAINNARTTCAMAKSKCSKDCDQAKSQAQSRPPQDPNRADAGVIPGIKSSRCEAPIDAELARLQQADSNLAKDGSEAGDSKDASQNGGMPPQMPQQGGGGGGGDGGYSPDPYANNNGVNCYNAGSERYSDCNDEYVSRCSGYSGGTGCQAFTDRYCNLKGGALTGGGTAKIVGGASVIVDKRGEGLGTSFCQDVMATNFCAQDGRGQCPSCMKRASAGCTGPDCLQENSPEMMKKAQETCPSDPMFMNGGFVTKKEDATKSTELNTNVPAAGAAGAGGSALSSTASSAGLGAGGGGGSGGMGADGTPAPVVGGATPEGTPQGLSVNFSDGGGAGGGYSPENNSEGDGRSPAAFNPAKFDESKGLPAAAVAGLAARDVSIPQGPSIFSIGSAAIKTYCSRKDLKGCSK